MARATADYDWDKDRPKGRENFPRGYFNLEVVNAAEMNTDRGLTYTAECEIIGPHADGTKDFDGQPVYLRFGVGHEEDLDAEDPLTWTKNNKVDSSRIAVQQLCDFEIATGVTKGEGRGAHPRDLFQDTEGKRLTVLTGENKKGYQTFKFYKFGEREPMLFGGETPARGRADSAGTAAGTAAPSAEEPRRARQPEPEPEDVEEAPPPRRRAR